MSDDKIEVVLGTYPLDMPTDLNKNTALLVRNFAEALAMKLLKVQQKYGYTDEWNNPELIKDMSQDLFDHIEKGVAAYCAFMWFHKVSVDGDQIVDKA